MYSGQLDVIVAAPLTERFLQTVPWSRLEEYKKAERSVWKIRSTDTEVAGYVRVAGEFAQVRHDSESIHLCRIYLFFFFQKWNGY